MNEKDVIKRSLKLFCIICFLLIVIGILFKDISYLLGYILGYSIAYIAFQLTILTSSEILKTQTSVIFIVLSVILKMILYALGFLVAIKVSFINIIGVFVGYLSTKISIYIEGYLQKGGEVNK